MLIWSCYKMQEAQTSTQTLELASDQVSSFSVSLCCPRQLTAWQVVDGAVIPVKFVKFQSVNSLTIFVGGNFGDKDRTVIHRHNT
jgi:hypothetical protein